MNENQHQITNSFLLSTSHQTKMLHSYVTFLDLSALQFHAQSTLNIEWSALRGPLQNLTQTFGEQARNPVTASNYSFIYS